jgi:glycosyltransferase involved in cell wall biosynthesis
MRILMAHNYYQQPGGEDQVFAAESAMLESRGHTVIRLTRHNDAVHGMSRTAVARAALWNGDSYREVRRLIVKEQIDLAHFHNTFPLISPAAYYAARSLRIPVVQSLHNYRLLCPGAFFLREGHVCEDCLKRAVPWPGVKHSCYRGSHAQSGVVAGMLTFHRMLGTWSGVVDRYIALTEFSRSKFIEGGLPARKISVKPNFLGIDPGVGRENSDNACTGANGQSYALFVGRLTEDKGLNVLMDAWPQLGDEIPLKIAGDGPLLESLTRKARDVSNVTVVGPTARPDVLELMKAARMLIVPSLWYEGLPMTIVEAFATGLPVVASNLGSLSSLVEHGVTGAHFPAGNAAALAGVVRQVWADPEKLRTMRWNARAAYEHRYSANSNYTTLMKIYEAATASKAQRAAAAGSGLHRVTTNS